MRQQCTSTAASLAWLAFACFVLALCLSGCATPRRESKAMTWHPNGKLATYSATSEVGAQILFGERQDVAAGPGVYAGGTIDKRTMGVVGGAVAGAAIGAYAGNPAIGALVGTVAGGIGQALDDHQTSGTQQTMTSPEIMKMILDAGNQAEAAKRAATATITPQKVSGAAQARDPPPAAKE